MRFFGRQAELSRLQKIWEQVGSDLIFVRGRRRIGKSELIRQFASQLPLGRAFLFAGRVDESDAAARSRFARDWDTLRGSTDLSDLRMESLTWDRIFGEITKAVTIIGQEGALLLAIDEIQWLAKKQSGVLGAFKEFWERTHQVGSLKVALAGSSNRFFAHEVDHAEGVLRGLRTKGDLWVPPFSLAEVMFYFFPNWTTEQIAFIYMLIGGTPYYLQRLDREKPFLRALNEALLTPDSIFLDEIDAILKVETTGEGALENVKRVLRALGQDGRTAAKIEEITGLGAANVHAILGRLETFNLIKERLPFGASKKKNKSGVRYFMEDFFLNTYFKLLEPLAARIRSNHNRGMLITELIDSDSGYHIRDFSGKAFELLILNVLKAGARDTCHREAPLFGMLAVSDSDIEIGTYWQTQLVQIDIIVTCTADRHIRILEAKWKSSPLAGAEGVGMVASLHKKSIRLPHSSWTTGHYFLASQGTSPSVAAYAKELQVEIATLADLFGPPLKL